LGLEFEGDRKIVNAALKAKAKAKKGPKAKDTPKFGFEAKAWPQGLHHWMLLIINTE